jgi:hypothetical protein
MKRRYTVILGALSLSLALVALYTINLQAAITVQLAPFYQSSEFSDRDAIAFQALQQLSYALYDIPPWAILAATVPAVVILIISMLSPRRLPNE